MTPRRLDRLARFGTHTEPTVCGAWLPRIGARHRVIGGRIHVGSVGQIIRLGGFGTVRMRFPEGESPHIEAKLLDRREEGA